LKISKEQPLFYIIFDENLSYCHFWSK